MKYFRTWAKTSIRLLRYPLLSIGFVLPRATGQLGGLSSSTTSALNGKGCGFESYQSDLPEDFFFTGLGKILGVKYFTHISVGVKPNNNISLITKC